MNNTIQYGKYDIMLQYMSIIAEMAKESATIICIKIVLYLEEGY